MQVEEVAPAKERARRAESLAKVAGAAGEYLSALEGVEKVDYVSLAVAMVGADLTKSHVAFGEPADLCQWFAAEAADLVRRLRDKAAAELAEL